MENKIKKDPWRPKIWTDEKIEQEAEALLDWIKTEGNYWLKDFTVKRGYYPQKLSEFANVSEYFAEALKVAKAVQESKIAKMGLEGKWNASMCIFALKNVAKWRDKFDEKPDNSAALEKISKFVQDIRDDKGESE